MIIFRYLAREVLVSMVAVSGVLLLIIMSGRFVKYLAEAASGKLDANVLFAVMAFRIPGFLELILPLGLFIGILLAYGRLYMDSEMVVLSACGMSQKRLVAYSLLPAVLVAVIVGGLALFVSPAGIEQANTILDSQKNRSEFDHLPPARFQSTGSGNNVTYAQELRDNRKLMHKVFMAEMSPRDESDTAAAPQLSVITAQSGRQVVDPDSGQRYLQLSDGYRHSGNPGDADYQVVAFETYWQHLPAPVQARGSVKADALSTLVLLGSDTRENVAALHWRFALPVLVFMVTLLAVPLSRTNPRQGRYVQMIPAILLYIIYLVSLNAARGAVEEGELSPWESIWAVHGLALLLAVSLLLWPVLRRHLKGRKTRSVAAKAGGVSHA